MPAVDAQRPYHCQLATLPRRLASLHVGRSCGVPLSSIREGEARRRPPLVVRAVFDAPLKARAVRRDRVYGDDARVGSCEVSDASMNMSPAGGAGDGHRGGAFMVWEIFHWSPGVASRSRSHTEHSRHGWETSMGCGWRRSVKRPSVRQSFA